MRRSRIVIAAALLGVAACAPVAPAGGASAADLPLERTEWTLVELDGRPVPPSDRAPTLVLDGSGRIGGSGGCNRFFGEYRRGGGDALAITGVGSTRMACMEPAGVMERESAYFQALERTATATVEARSLTLAAPSGPVLRFTGAPPAE